mmetsp:Transcript_60475/g.107818  ORF Transcript_60475/g.107818 Transcript_60475/m.107818 type:complete len:81 (+) Transcript_60475:2078-2320(+)
MVPVKEQQTVIVSILVRPVLLVPGTWLLSSEGVARQSAWEGMRAWDKGIQAVLELDGIQRSEGWGTSYAYISSPYCDRNR